MRMIEFRKMETSERNKFLALISFHLLWAFVLWFSISKLGLGVSTDSVHLLFGGMNFAETGRLVSFDGSPLLQWPPLYPVLLAGIHFVSGMSAFGAAHLLHIAAYVGFSTCTSLLFLRMFPDDFPLAVAGCVLSDIGVVIVAGFDLVGSDYVHLCLVMLFLLLTARYVESNSPKSFAALVVVGMLAMLDRYLGIAAIVTGVVAVLFLAGGSRRQRLVRALILALSALPASIWLLVTSPLIVRRAPLSLAENLRWFSGSLAEWFVPAAVVEAHPVRAIILLWIFILGLVATVFAARYRNVPTYARPVLLFGAVYTLALFGSASIEYFNKLGGRFLLPLYIPFITLALVCAHTALNASKRLSPTLRRAALTGIFGSLEIAALLAIQISAPSILQSHAGASSVSENAFNTEEWDANSAMQFWVDHQPEGSYALLSNEPDGVAFHTGHAVAAAPRRYPGPYGNTEIPIQSYAGQLFSEARDTYLIWIEPNEHDYYYSPEELGAVADLRVLFQSKDGTVYQLSSKAGE
jgi:hypothetical protein